MGPGMDSCRIRPARRMNPTLFTFDIFGTVIDWLRGMQGSLRSSGRELTVEEFERVIDLQSVLERGAFRGYSEIASESLVQTLGIDAAKAREIAAQMGCWPLFLDAAMGLRQLMKRAPCVAMTNSDRVHGGQVQAQLGFQLSDWICAEEIRCYKPSAKFWRATASRLGRALDKSWCHVSAYGDYDLGVARQLGLATAFISRPHCRPAPADISASDLMSLSRLLE